MKYYDICIYWICNIYFFDYYNREHMKNNVDNMINEINEINDINDGIIEIIDRIDEINFNINNLTKRINDLELNEKNKIENNNITDETIVFYMNIMISMFIGGIIIIIF